MRHILTRSGQKVLERLARARCAVVLDFDGTLAPLADDPAAARPRPATRELLRELKRHYPSAVISGRPWEDVSARLEGTGIEPIVGSYGADWGFLPVPAATVARRVQGWAATLRARLRDVAGARVEEKPWSVTVHYRGVEDKARVAQAARSAAGTLWGARVRHGKDAVHVVPAELPDKAVALTSVCRMLRCESALYVGDDVNDEPVFALCDEERLVGVRVGAARDTLATFFVDDQEQVDDLLAALVRLRAHEGRAHA